MNLSDQLYIPQPTEKCTVYLSLTFTNLGLRMATLDLGVKPILTRERARFSQNDFLTVLISFKQFRD